MIYVWNQDHIWEKSHFYASEYYLYCTLFQLVLLNVLSSKMYFPFPFPSLVKSFETGLRIGGGAERLTFLSFVPAVLSLALSAYAFNGTAWKISKHAIQFFTNYVRKVPNYWQTIVCQ